MTKCLQKHCPNKALCRNVRYLFSTITKSEQYKLVGSKKSWKKKIVHLEQQNSVFSCAYQYPIITL